MATCAIWRLETHLHSQPATGSIKSTPAATIMPPPRPGQHKGTHQHNGASQPQQTLPATTAEGEQPDTNADGQDEKASQGVGIAEEGREPSASVAHDQCMSQRHDGSCRDTG